MKMQFFINAIFIISIAACNTNSNSQVDNDTVQTTDVVQSTVSKQDSFVTGKIITPIICKADASQSYAAYIPSAQKNLPVIFCFDPHADGSLPLKNYKALADKYNFILIGSNNSKNGNDVQAAQNIWNTLYNDVEKRISFDTSRIYVCGFSGGAKVASQIAIQNNFIKGVIADGAGLPDGVQPSDYGFSFTGIAGKGDMNMTDLVATNNAFDATTTMHRIILFDGKHAWAPAEIMNTAFLGFDFDAMNNNIIPENDSLINSYVEDSRGKVNLFKLNNGLIAALDECTLSINLLGGLTKETYWFTTQANEIESSRAFKTQQDQQQSLFTTEQNMKTTYNQQFKEGDVAYWTKTINDLEEKSQPSTPEGAMYNRLLAYLSLAFYSISNQLINQNSNADAVYFDSLYKIADSTNSEAWYFSAILNARNKKIQQTKSDLLKSIDLGFNDKARIQAQPDFQPISRQLGLIAIESKIQ